MGRCREEASSTDRRYMHQLQIHGFMGFQFGISLSVMVVVYLLTLMKELCLWPMFTKSKLHACCCFSFSKHIPANGWSTYVDSTWWWWFLYGIVVSESKAPNCHI
ncbi:hypothetical protein ES288_D01G202000v1 [Gossypium darwinii]|uniref:Uncharacterized protein n=1 Tax=Gossypium darwinii TaxID=34276 RepID=A0A5D2DS79_GOSDA|nr:hypothetical protein ES288_D01G202000v1 [Gossypium darwinii]